MRKRPRAGRRERLICVPSGSALLSVVRARFPPAVREVKSTRLGYAGSMRNTG